MKVARFDYLNATHIGVIEGDGLIDLGLEGEVTTRSVLRSIISGGGLRLPETPEVVALHQVRLLTPLAPDTKSYWVGANYANLRDNRTGSAPGGEYPSLFIRTPASLAAHEEAIVYPKVSEQLDYEGEVVLVIGHGGRYIPQKKALEHVGGITIANDGSVRDWMNHSKVNVTAGKNFDRSGSLGPWIVTADEVDLSKPLSIETKVNGSLRQSDTTQNLRFSFAELISYVSRFTTLETGDLISTGSPAGAGGGPFGFDPPQWPKPADVLEISVSGIGTLRNHVRAE